jgi:hypothetical protein
MSLKYEIEQVDELPVREKKPFIKGSKYDAIVDDIVKRNVPNLKIAIPKMKSQYIVTQLNKRFKAKNINTFLATTINNTVFVIQVEPEEET